MENLRNLNKVGKAGDASGMRIKLMMVREGTPLQFNIDGPEAAFQFLREKAAGLDRECFWRVDLDARNQVIGYELVSMGTVTASLVHPREVFKGAILNNAVTIIVAHNHPSQQVTPSSEDREVTRRLARAGEVMGVPLVDHLVLADREYFSFKERGLM